MDSKSSWHLNSAAPGATFVWRVQFLVPLRFGDGRRVPRRVHGLVRDGLLAGLPGLTCRGVTDGFWWADGRLVRDRCREYYVDLPSPAAADDAAVVIAAVVARAYDQRAVEVNVTQRRSTVFIEQPGAVRRPSSPRRVGRVVAGLFALLCCARCDVQAFRSVFVDAPPAVPVTLDVVCDASGSSSGCSEASLSAFVDGVVPGLPGGSVVRLQAMSDTVFDGRELARHVVSVPRKKTRAALQRHRLEQARLVREAFVGAAAPLFTESRRASPIAETIARTVLAGNPSGGVHHVAVLTDGRQFSKHTPSLGRLDLECGTPPSPDDFARRLQPLFPPKALEGVVLHFVNVQLDPVANNRCAATIEGYRALQDLWTTSLSQLGARVTWSMGPVPDLGKEQQ